VVLNSNPYLSAIFLAEEPVLVEIPTNLTSFLLEINGKM